MTNVQPEKGVPLPKRMPGPSPKYPWRTMDVNESFAIDNVAPHAAAWAYNKRLAPKEFVGGRHEGKPRVWRVK